MEAATATSGCSGVPGSKNLYGQRREWRAEQEKDQRDQCELVERDIDVVYVDVHRFPRKPQHLHQGPQKDEPCYTDQHTRNHAVDYTAGQWITPRTASALCAESPRPAPAWSPEDHSHPAD